MHNSLTIICVLFILQVSLFLLGAAISLRKTRVSGAGRRLTLVIRMYISFSLVFTAFIIFWTNSSQETSLYSFFVFLGMAVSFVGDLIMTRVMLVKMRLVDGMIFFSAAHGFYITAYIKTMILNNVQLRNYVLLDIIVFLVVIVCEWLILIRKSNKIKLTYIAGIIYGGILTSMTVFAFSLAVSVGGRWWITCVAAVFFIVSDLIIAITEIGNVKLKNTGLWVWLTYVAAQMGIIYVTIL